LLKWEKQGIDNNSDDEQDSEAQEALIAVLGSSRSQSRKEM